MAFWCCGVLASAERTAVCVCRFSRFQAKGLCQHISPGGCLTRNTRVRKRCGLLYLLVILDSVNEKFTVCEVDDGGSDGQGGKISPSRNGNVSARLCAIVTFRLFVHTKVPLLRSIQPADLRTAICLLATGRSPLPIFVLYSVNMNGATIFDACRTGDLAAIEEICRENNTAVNTTDAKGFTPLILAAYNNQPAVVDLLLQYGADSNTQDVAGNTALMGVCFKGYKNIAKKLIEAGADLNVRNANGTTALAFAATFGQLQIAEWLLQNGAKSNLADSNGKTLLQHAAIQENEEMVELIRRYSPPSA